jgi:alpha-beta hydrolase superfamily lysophospholipase
MPSGNGSRLAAWARAYPFAPRYRLPAVPLRFRASDGTRLAAVRVPGPPDAAATIVVVHGFTNSSRSPEIYELVHALSAWAHVIALDLRGHRRSGGRCTLGPWSRWGSASAALPRCSRWAAALLRPV